jgi:hypothetical protein
LNNASPKAPRACVPERTPEASTGVSKPESKDHSPNTTGDYPRNADSGVKKPEAERVEGVLMIITPINEVLFDGKDFLVGIGTETFVGSRQDIEKCFRSWCNRFLPPSQDQATQNLHDNTLAAMIKRLDDPRRI